MFFHKNVSWHIYKSLHSSTNTSKPFLSPIISSSSVTHALSSLKSSSYSLEERRHIDVMISSSMTACGWIGVISVPKVGQCQRMDQVKTCFLYPFLRDLKYQHFSNSSV